MLKTRFYALLPRAFLIVWGMWLLNRMWLPHQTGAAINRFMHCTVLDILLTFRQTMEWAVFYFNLSLSDEVIWIWILWLSWIFWSIYTLTSSYVKVDGRPLYFPLENVWLINLSSQCELSSANSNIYLTLSVHRNRITDHWSSWIYFITCTVMLKVKYNYRSRDNEKWAKYKLFLSSFLTALPILL